MPFNNRKWNLVRLYGKGVNLSKIGLCSEIHTTIQCIFSEEENPQNCPFPLCHPARGGLSHGDRQHAREIGNDFTCHSGDMLVNRETDEHTDVLITILYHAACGQSNNNNKNNWKVGQSPTCSPPGVSKFDFISFLLTDWLC